MKKETSLSTEVAETSQASTEFKAVPNPRKAATKLKEINSNVEVMKKRFKVLQVQDEYNRYKTIDQQKRINYHQQIHQKLQQEREFLKKSLEKIHDSSELKEKRDQLRQQIREKIKQARQNLHEDRIDRTNSIYQEFLQHTELIKQNQKASIDLNREKKLQILREEEHKRESLSRHREKKVQSVRIGKSMDSGALTQRAQKGQAELNRLMQYEQELLKKSSDSLQASQVMRHKFNEVFSTISTSRLLPEIRARAHTGKQTASTELVII